MKHREKVNVVLWVLFGFFILIFAFTLFAYKSNIAFLFMLLAYAPRIYAVYYLKQHIDVSKKIIGVLCNVYIFSLILFAAFFTSVCLVTINMGADLPQ